MSDAIDAAAREQLRGNAQRLLDAALQADAAQWAAEDAAAPSSAFAPTEPAPLLDLANMDLGMLDGLGDKAPAAPADAAALRQALAAVPAGLPPLTAALSEGGFAQWLAAYRQGDPAVAELLTLALR